MCLYLCKSSFLKVDVGKDIPKFLESILSLLLDTVNTSNDNLELRFPWLTAWEAPSK